MSGFKLKNMAYWKAKHNSEPSPGKYIGPVISGVVTGGLDAIGASSPGGKMDMLLDSTDKMRGPKVLRKMIGMLDKKMGGRFSKEYPTMAALGGYNQGGWTSEERKVSQDKKKLHQHEKYQHAMLEKKKLADKHRSKKSGYTKDDLKKYKAGNPKRKKIYDALNWKYDDTI